MLTDADTSHSKLTKLPTQTTTITSSTPAFSTPEKIVAPSRLYHPMTPIELQETDNNYIAYLYIDACPEARFIVTVRDGMLYIRQVNGAPINDYRENWSGNFSYGFLLPVNADSDSVHANRKEGVLKVEIDKH